MTKYAISDLHGRYELYESVNNFIQPNDEVICLGDCGDRGPRGWELIKAVLANPQWTYIYGNHEDMLLNAMFDFKDKLTFKDNYELLRYNGGEETIRGWLRETEEDKDIYMAKLQELPTIVDYYNKNGTKVILTHAGFSPNKKEEELELHDLIWDRKHFAEEFETNEDVIVVHGHTPISYLKRIREDIWEPVDRGTHSFWYAKGQKVCIDNHAFKTKEAILLNLDNFNENIIF